MERVQSIDFSGGDASYFIMALQEWHTTEANPDRVTVEAAMARMCGKAKAWASALPHDVTADAEAFFTALATRWPPHEAISCSNLRAMTQAPGQSVDEFITDISYR